MEKLLKFWPGFRLLGCGAIATLAFTGPADARFVSTDSLNPSSIDACDLGQPCSANNLGIFLGGTYQNPADGNYYQVNDLGDFANLYIYKDGIVSLGHALPSNATVGDASTLGDAFIAPAFADYINPADPGKALAEVEVAFYPYDGTIKALNIYWRLHDGSLFGLEGLSNGGIVNGAGGGFGGWWGPVDIAEYTPDGAIVGSNGAFTQTFAGTPEPATWTMLLIGFGLAGAAMRRRSAGLLAS